MTEFRVSNRVKVYATLNGVMAESKGTVCEITKHLKSPRLTVILDSGQVIFAHPKQCRKLKAKSVRPPQEVFVKVHPEVKSGEMGLVQVEASIHQHQGFHRYVLCEDGNDDLEM